MPVSVMYITPFVLDVRLMNLLFDVHLPHDELVGRRDQVLPDIDRCRLDIAVR